MNIFVMYLFVSIVGYVKLSNFSLCKDFAALFMHIFFSVLYSFVMVVQLSAG